MFSYRWRTTAEIFMKIENTFEINFNKFNMKQIGWKLFFFLSCGKFSEIVYLHVKDNLLAKSIIWDCFLSSFVTGWGLFETCIEKKSAKMVKGRVNKVKLFYKYILYFFSLCFFTLHLSQFLMLLFLASNDWHYIFKKFITSILDKY